MITLTKENYNEVLNIEKLCTQIINKLIVDNPILLEELDKNTSYCIDEASSDQFRKISSGDLLSISDWEGSLSIYELIMCTSILDVLGHDLAVLSELYSIKEYEYKLKYIYNLLTNNKIQNVKQ